jgi:hypothetical protein
VSTPPIQYTGPPISPDVPWSISQHIQLLYQKLGNHAQAFQMQQAQIATIKAGATTTVIEAEGTGGGSSGGGTTVSGVTLLVNNQSGSTTYTTMSGDNGAMIVFTVTVAVSLTSQDPPWGAFIANIGTGTVTLTPASGTINNAATFVLAENSSAIIAFDGTNWWATPIPVVPINTPAIAHEWLNSYNAETGAFTQTQPAFTDISGTATAAQVPALSALTGQITESQLPSAGLSVTITTAMLTPTGTEGSLTFTNGILTAQTPAT